MTIGYILFILRLGVSCSEGNRTGSPRLAVTALVSRWAGGAVGCRGVRSNPPASCEIAHPYEFSERHCPLGCQHPAPIFFVLSPWLRDICSPGPDGAHGCGGRHQRTGAAGRPDDPEPPANQRQWEPAKLGTPPLRPVEAGPRLNKRRWRCWTPAFSFATGAPGSLENERGWHD